MNLNKIGSVIGIFLVLLLVWGLIEPYFIDIQTEQAAIKNLPVEWEGKKVAVFGDFQVGMWLDNTATVNEAAEEIASLKPDAVLIIGDFIYHSVADRDKEMEHVEELIRPLTETGIPIFAVLGNHDFDMDLKKDEPNEEAAQNVVSSLKAIGITVLHNKAVPLKLTGENRVTTGKSSTGTLYIAGLGAAWPKNSKPGKALEDVPNDSPRIVMMHNPNTFGKLPAESASFAVAGHTHGGQFRIPFLPESSYLTYKKEEEVHADGWIDGYGASGNNLYVNRGIGFSDLPLRINAMPEVTLFTLKSL